MFDLILYVPGNNLQLCRDGSYWVESVLSKDKYVLLKDTTQWRRWGWDPWFLGLESNGLPLSHCASKSKWYIENTRWVSFDIKFTRQGFENACWHREACRAIQRAFSKPSLVNLISNDANLVFYLSVYPSFHSSNKRLWRNFRFLCWFSVISDVIQKVQRHHDLIKATCREIDNVYQATRNNELIWEVTDKLISVGRICILCLIIKLNTYLQ